MIEVLRKARVMPVIEIDDVASAIPLAEALDAGGLQVFEFTLRTPAALGAIEAAKKARPDLAIGAGTVLSIDDAERSIAAGADFLVTPGATPALLAALSRLGTPVLPGVATASEAMAVMEAGINPMKFFPAEAAGGPAYLKLLAGPLPKALFCPTGGIGPERVDDYLALPNVVCVGGSWVAPKDAVAAKDWARITENARRAAGGESKSQSS